MGSAPDNDDTDSGRQVDARARRRSTLSVVAVVVLIVATTTTLALLSRETGQRVSNTARSEESHSGSEIVKGVACPDLREAATLFAQEDQKGFVAAIKRAGREAEDALQRDGVVFGRPEALALELSYLVTRDEGVPDARVHVLVSRGVDACLSQSRKLT